MARWKEVFQLSGCAVGSEDQEWPLDRPAGTSQLVSVLGAFKAVGNHRDPGRGPASVGLELRCTVNDMKQAQALKTRCISDSDEGVKTGDSGSD